MLPEKGKKLTLSHVLGETLKQHKYRTIRGETWLNHNVFFARDDGSAVQRKNQHGSVLVVIKAGG